MMPILPYFALALVFSCATASSTTQREHLPPLEPAEHVDLARYVGVWYEISALPQRFQKNCTGTTATYTWRDDGDIDVLNRCRDGSLDGPERSIHGKARLPDPRYPAKLEVSFFWPVWADYWILEVGPNYEYAVVGHPSRDYLWILSRVPQLDPHIYDRILASLRGRHHYDITRLQQTLQPAQARG